MSCAFVASCRQRSMDARGIEHQSYSACVRACVCLPRSIAVHGIHCVRRAREEDRAAQDQSVATRGEWHHLVKASSCESVTMNVPRGLAALAVIDGCCHAQERRSRATTLASLVVRCRDMCVIVCERQRIGTSGVAQIPWCCDARVSMASATASHLLSLQRCGICKTRQATCAQRRHAKRRVEVEVTRARCRCIHHS